MVSCRNEGHLFCIGKLFGCLAPRNIHIYVGIPTLFGISPPCIFCTSRLSETVCRRASVWRW
jgi:hypothetical protein